MVLSKTVFHMVVTIGVILSFTVPFVIAKVRKSRVVSSHFVLSLLLIVSGVFYYTFYCVQIFEIEEEGRLVRMIGIGNFSTTTDDSQIISTSGGERQDFMIINSTGRALVMEPLEYGDGGTAHYGAKSVEILPHNKAWVDVEPDYFPDQQPDKTALTMDGGTTKFWLHFDYGSVR